MNRLCIVAKNFQTHFIRRLTEEVGGDVASFNPWEDSVLPPAEVYLLRSTGIYGSSKDLEALSGERNVINSIRAHRIFREKQSQYTFFDSIKHPSLTWLNLRSADLSTARTFVSDHEEILVKPNRGQGGWGIEVLNCQTIQSWWDRGDLDYVAQPYRPDLREGRLFFIGTEQRWILEREKAQGAVAANFKQEGRARVLSLPSTHLEILEGLIQESGAAYGAIDFLFDASEVFTLELNVVPGIEQLEMTTGENVARLLAAKYLSQKIKVSHPSSR